MIVANYECKRCGLRTVDRLVCSPASTNGPLCCGERMSWIPSFGRKRNAAWADRDAVVVWEGPKGEVNYPPRNDVPIPERLRQRGFVRKEMKSLREVERFEGAHGVRNERAWFDKSSGRGFEDGNKFGV